MLAPRLRGIGPAQMAGTALVAIWGLAVFALALDRYGAAFLPAGQRAAVMGLLLLVAVPFMLADRVLLADAPLWRRALARILAVVVLAAVMVANPGGLGLHFTAIPVLALFYIAFGTMGRAVARRSGPEAAGLGLAICLAWAFAASLPMFAA